MADQLDPVAEGMFYRGWPLSPCMTCLVYFMKFHPSEVGVHGILVLDGVVFVVALQVTKGICELFLRRRNRPSIKTPPGMQPQSDPPPAGSTSGPGVE